MLYTSTQTDSGVVKDCNIILSTTYEYRPPSQSSLQVVASETNKSSLQLPFSSRYVGLVVVPGQYITKIEHEGFYMPEA